MIKYVKKNLFDAPEDAILVHACNAQGVWGSGIAKEFKEKFPQAYQTYKSYCGEIKTKFPESFWAGHANFVVEWHAEDHGLRVIDRKICNLITSKNYGDKKDDVQTILFNTVVALEELGQRAMQLKKRPYCSNKFNSGLFEVPWEETEKILTYFVERYKLDWTVYTGEE